MKNIHIRYQASGDAKYAFGITLDTITVHSTNKDRKIIEVMEEKAKMAYKLITLKNLAVYWNSFSPAPSSLDKAELIDFLQCQVRKN